MKYFLLFLCLLSLISCNFSGNNESVIRVSDLINNYGERGYELSGSGKYIAFIKSNHQSKALYIKSTDNFQNGKLQLVNDTVKENHLDKFRWIGDTSILYVVKDSLNYFTIKNHNFTKNTTKAIAILKKNFSFLPATKDLSHVYLGINERDSVFADVYDLNLTTNQISLYCKNFGNVFRWFLNDQGEIYAAATVKEMNKEFWFKDSIDGKFKKEFSYDLDGFFIPYYNKTNKHLVYGFQNVFSDKSAVITYDVEQHKVINTIFENKDFDVSGVNFSPNKSKIEAISYEGFYQEYQFYTDEAEILNRKIKQYFDAEKFSYFVTNQSLDENFKIILVKTDRYPGGYFLYNKQKQSLELLSEINPLFSYKESKKFVKLDTISFLNKNNKTVQGYVTAQDNDENLPLAVLLHRNIRMRDAFRYNNICQFFANRGYRVYQINYSGSTGYGKTFRELGDKQIGKNIYDDIIAGYNEVKKRYKVDKSRVIIYGEGVAGCIALQAVTMPNHPFKSVIVNSASLNLFSHIKAVSYYNKKNLSTTYKQIGNPSVDINYLKFASPIFNVSKINVPVLMGFNFSDQISGNNENMDFIRIMQSEKKDIYFFSTATKEDVYDINTYEVPFFETVHNFLLKK